MDLLEISIEQAKALKQTAEMEMEKFTKTHGLDSHGHGWNKGLSDAYQNMIDYMEDLLKNSETAKSDQG